MNNQLKTVTFTKLEQEIIEHRLDASDALAECLYDTYEWPHEQVELTCERMKACLEEHGAVSIFEDDEVAIEVLRDCVEGSTFFGSMSHAVACGETTKGKALASRKAARAIERKLKAAGVECEFPSW